MVRRRVSRTFEAVPEWVRVFDVGAWPAVTVFDSWRLWRQAVRDYCVSERLVSRDLRTWTELLRSTYRTAAVLRGDRAAE